MTVAKLQCLMAAQGATITNLCSSLNLKTIPYKHFKERVAMCGG